MRKLAPMVFLFAVFLLVGISGCTRPIEEARDAYNKGDYKTAYRIFKPHAGRGDVDAQFSLGEMSRKGQGVLRDDAEALKWYRRAADQGHADAQNNLGICYTLGQGVPVDYVQALMWYSIAASNSSAGMEHAGAVSNRDAIVSMMTSAQVDQAQNMAREWKPKKEKEK